MPNMHVSLFIRLADRIESNSMAHGETESFSVTVKVGSNGERNEIWLFADSLNQLADFGRAIVRECEKLAPVDDASDPFLPSAPPICEPSDLHNARIEFEARSRERDELRNAMIAPYAINDAVQHDEAMEAAAKAGPNPMPF